MTSIDKSTKPSASIVRGTGSTDSERRLAKLADISFLKLWSYPNSHRSKTSSKGHECKEICDLLVVCDNHVIIFSDKSINWSGNDDDISWTRWARKAILGSKKQMLGAVKWINENPRQIYTDNSCKSSLPINLPPCDSMKLHLVLVTQGAEAACKERYNGTSGSLVIRPSVVGGANWDRKESEFRPFNIGDVNPDGSFMHVFDFTSLELLMSELDTVVDFTNYLTLREKYLRSGNLLEAHGEENLFATYISHADENDEHDFPYDTVGASATIQRGRYEKIRNRREYELKKEHNKISYFWDDIINEFNTHVIDGTLLGKNGNPANVEDAEKGLRFMALETRLSRRGYGEAFYDALKMGNRGPIFKRLVVDSETTKIDKTAFLALTCKHLKEMGDYTRYSEIRQRLLFLYTREALMKNPNIKHIVGIAFEPSNTTNDGTKTMICHEQSEWTDAQRDNVNSTLNLLNRKPSTPTHHRHREYPDV